MKSEKYDVPFLLCIYYTYYLSSQLDGMNSTRDVIARSDGEEVAWFLRSRLLRHYGHTLYLFLTILSRIV